MKTTVCIYGTYENFNDEIDEINQELQESDIEFVKPQLGGGLPPENILDVFFVIANSFILSYAYDKTKAFILKCLDKHRKVSEKEGVKPVININIKKDLSTEYTTIRLENCSDEVMIEALDKALIKTDNNE